MSRHGWNISVRIRPQNRLRKKRGSSTHVLLFSNTSLVPSTVVRRSLWGLFLTIGLNHTKTAKVEIIRMSSGPIDYRMFGAFEKGFGGQAQTQSGIPILPAMTPVCVGCQRRISSKDGLFLYLPDPYFALIHKECAPFFTFSGVWPHRQTYHYYISKNNRPQPGKTPSPTQN